MTNIHGRMDRWTIWDTCNSAAAVCLSVPFYPVLLYGLLLLLHGYLLVPLLYQAGNLLQQTQGNSQGKPPEGFNKCMAFLAEVYVTCDIKNPSRRIVARYFKLHEINF